MANIDLTVLGAERPDTIEATQLIAELDVCLALLYPSESRHGFSIDKLLREAVDFFVLRHDGEAVACGGVKFFGTEYAEVKRMYVRPGHRKKGLGARLLNHLAAHSAQQGIEVLRLETGIYQTDAILGQSR